jgi:hypothetical protein
MQTLQRILLDIEMTRGNDSDYDLGYVLFRHLDKILIGKDTNHILIALSQLLSETLKIHAFHDGVVD